MNDDDRLALRTYLLDLVFALWNDDSADGLTERLPSPPSMVTDVQPELHRWDAQRVGGFVLSGSFDIEAIMSMAEGGGEFMSRYDVCVGYVTPFDRPEHLGARFTIDGQPGMTVGTLTVEAETLRNPPTNPNPPAAVSPKPAAATAAPPPLAADDEPEGPLIGGVEAVPAIDLRAFFDEEAFAKIETWRASPDVAVASVYEAADSSTFPFGSPPDFEQVISLGTGGMTIGYMIDAPELGFVPHLGCLYEISSAGMTLTDARVNPLQVMWRSVTERRLQLEAAVDDGRLERWGVAAERLKHAMGWLDFASSGIAGFAWRDKRRKPLGAPAGTKWRTDAGGNGVLASVDAWGAEGVRKPGSIDRALARAGTADPAAAYLLLREALVIANRDNDAGAALEIYRAMVDPLERLDRAAVAARAAALGDL